MALSLLQTLSKNVTRSNKISNLSVDFSSSEVEEKDGNHNKYYK